MKRSDYIRLSVFGSCLVLAFAYTNCGNEVSFQEMPTALNDSGANKFSSGSDSSISIEAGAEFTNQDVVQLKIYSPRALEMKLSNLEDCSDGEWEAYSESKAWSLSEQNKNVRVYASFKNIKDETTECISDAIVHDNIAPILAFTTAENQITKSTRMDIAWEAKDELSGIASTRCSDLNGQSGECENRYSVMAGVEGTNSLSVQLKDKAGNTSPIYNFNWVQDTTLPKIQFTQQPASISGSSSATIGFVIEDDHAGRSLCSLNGAAFSECASPLILSNLKEGANSLGVKAIDLAGNESAASRIEWVVDLTAPNIELTSTPSAYSNQSQAQFGFRGTDNGMPINRFECRLGATQAFQACSSPHTVSGLSVGRHSFEVRGVDSAGNKSAAVSYSWVIDTTAPSVRIVQSPAAFTNSTQANIQWQATDSDSGIERVECSLNNGAFEACPNSSKTLMTLAQRQHSFQVRAIDRAGNQATATAQWTVDTTAPSLEITAYPNKYVSTFDAQFNFLGTDANGISHYECKVDSNAFNRCSRPHDLKNLMPGGHEFFVRAVDQAGNQSAVKTYAWTIDIDAPLIRVVSAPSALRSDEQGVVSYEVVDTGSRLAQVRCGLISPRNTTTNCESTAQINLGQLAAGNYIFLIYAEDNVGNIAREELAIEVTDRPLVCDPFSSNGEQLCNGGLVGDLYYLRSEQWQSFKNLSSSQKSVNYIFEQGTMVDAILNFKELNVPTRVFDQGFPAKGQALLTNNKGETLIEYFAMRLETVLKLDPQKDLKGWYQLATISDDGSIVSYKLDPMSSNYQILVNNDGDHATQMGCSNSAIYIDDSSRIPLEVKYYQGPRTRIAMSLIWRRVDSMTAANDSSCGRSGGDTFYGPAPHNDFSNRYEFGQLLQRGWKVIGHTNMIAPPK